MGFGLSKAFKGVTKRFKKVAKGIKKLGKKVMGGIMKIPGMKQLGSLYSKTFGKLGPLGMIAASFVLPGIGGMLASGWGSAAGALAGSGSTFLQAVGSGMQAISTGLSTAGGAISKTFSQVTDKIAGVFTNSGGTDNFLSKASEWVSTKYDAAAKNFGEAGDWIKEKVGMKAPGAPSSLSPDAQAVISNNPELLGVSNAQARSQLAAITDSQKARSLLGDEATKMTFDPKQQLSINQQFVQTPNLAKEAVLKTTGSEVASAETLGSNLSTATQGRAAASGESFAKKALKAGATLLAPPAVAPSYAEFGASLPSVGDDFLSQRFGASGSGSAGGQFLTPQQQEFFSQHAKILGQVG
jgi:hypothetical protein